MIDHLGYVHIAWTILIVVYVALAIFNYYAMYMYRIACNDMKKTLIIKWVYLLLVALFIENVYFASVAIIRFIIGPLIIPSLLEHPLIWALVKGIVLVGLVGFIRASLNPNQKLDGCKEITVKHEMESLWARFVKKVNDLRIKLKNKKGFIKR